MEDAIIIMQHAVFLLCVYLYMIERRLTICSHGKLSKNREVGLKLTLILFLLAFSARLS
jgi:hypothetical protein